MSKADTTATTRQDLRQFVTAKEARRGSELPRRFRTEEEIKQEMKASVQRNAATLQTLSKL